MRQVAEGTPINPGEGAFVLEDKGGGHFGVTPLIEPRMSGEAGEHKGPARVNTKAYQAGWDALFGGKKPVAQA
jgi:hypothetical protein